MAVVATVRVMARTSMTVFRAWAGPVTSIPAAPPATLPAREDSAMPSTFARARGRRCSPCWPAPVTFPRRRAWGFPYRLDQLPGKACGVKSPPSPQLFGAAGTSRGAFGGPSTPSAARKAIAKKVVDGGGDYGPWWSRAIKNGCWLISKRRWGGLWTANWAAGATRQSTKATTPWLDRHPRVAP